MFYKKLWQWGRIAAVLAMIIMLAGCLPTKGEKPMAVVMDAYNRDLAKFIPDKPFNWRYSGTADYIQVMSVTDVFETDATKVCKVQGEVQDLSNGESNMDFKIALTYSIGSDSLVQDKKGKAMMDSEFDSLVLLKSPVAKGTTWEQPVVYPDGKQSTLKAAITNLETDASGRTVTVEYGDAATHYFERRKIREGSGVIFFEKSLNYHTESTLVGYKLDNADTVASDAAQAQAAPLGTEVVKAGDEDAAIKAAVMAFDQGWIGFVNNSDPKIYDTLVKDGQAYKLVKNFKRDGSLQKFEEIRVDEIEVLGNKAQAKVYERIRQTKSDHTRVLTYNWIYHLTKVKNVWYIDYYEQNAAVKSHQ